MSLDYSAARCCIKINTMKVACMIVMLLMMEYWSTDSEENLGQILPTFWQLPDFFVLFKNNQNNSEEYVKLNSQPR